MHIERELTFRIPADAKSRLWSLLPGAPVPSRRRLNSSYYDTPDFRLRGAQVTLRLRRDGRMRVLCFKTESTGMHGVPHRREWEASVPAGGFSPEALPCAEIKSAAGVDLRRLAAAMVPVFETRIARHSAEIVLPDGTRVKVCVDSGTIVAGRRRVPLLELELELVDGSPASMLALVEALVEPLRLELEVRSKAEQGYRMIESRSASPLKAQPLRLRRGMTAEEAMLAILDSCRTQVQGNLFGTMHSRNPEFLHQLRVGLRRLRSALQTFEPLVSASSERPVAREVKAMVSRLGSARDWDVFYLRLSQQLAPPAGRTPEMARLLRKVRARRSAALRQARETLASAAFQEFLLHLMRWTEDVPWRRSPGVRRVLSCQAGHFGRRELARRERKALRHADGIDWTDPEARHRLRILVKRLRYACEFFSEMLPSKMTRRYLGRLEALQDALGELNDIAVGGKLLRDLGKGVDPEQMGFVHGWFAARQSMLVAQLGVDWRSWKKEVRFA